MEGMTPVLSLLLAAGAVLLSSILITLVRRDRVLWLFTGAFACLALSALLQYLFQGGGLVVRLVAGLLRTTPYMLLYAGICARFRVTGMWPARFWFYLAGDVAGSMLDAPLIRRVLHMGAPSSGGPPPDEGAFPLLPTYLLILVMLVELVVLLLRHAAVMPRLVRMTVDIALIGTAAVAGVQAAYRVLLFAQPETVSLQYQMAAFSAYARMILTIFWFAATLMIDGTGLLERQRAERELYAVMMRSLPEGVVMTDDKGIITLFNPMGEQIGGVPAGEVLGRLSSEVFRLQNLMTGEALPDPVQEVLRTGVRVDSPRYCGLVRRDGTECFIEGSATPVPSSDGRTAGVVVSFRDITREYEQEKGMEAFFDVNIELLSIMDEQGMFQRVNRKFEEILGYRVEEVEGTHFLDYIHPGERERIRADLLEAARKRSVTAFVGRFRRRDGAWRYIEWYTMPGIGGLVYSSGRDVTERKMREERMAQIGYHDSLTGLYNRRFLEEEVRRLDTARNLPLSIIMGDMNGLKLINDAFGHEQGDEFIRKAARAIRAGCRSGDLAARWGGDEFMICLPETGLDDARKVVERIVAQCREAHVNGFEISIAFGLSTKSDKGMAMADVLHEAEECMYRQKANDRRFARGDVINAVRLSLYQREPEEEAHARLVGNLCRRTALALGLGDDAAEKLAQGGLMHDIGKVAVNPRILEKKGRLTENEWSQIRRHPEIGFRVVSSQPDLEEIGHAILAHHERLDGSGYPKGVGDGDIGLYARIIAVTESYASMIRPGTYGKGRHAISRDEAVAEIRRNEGVQFDPQVAEVFIGQVVYGEDPAGAEAGMRSEGEAAGTPAAAAEGFRGVPPQDGVRG